MQLALEGTKHQQLRKKRVPVPSRTKGKRGKKRVLWLGSKRSGSLRRR